MEDESPPILPPSQSSDDSEADSADQKKQTTTMTTTPEEDDDAKKDAEEMVKEEEKDQKKEEEEKEEEQEIVEEDSPDAANGIDGNNGNNNANNSGDAASAGTMFILKIRLPHIKGDVTKSVKVHSTSAVKSVCEFIGRKMNIRDWEHFCLFWPDDESEESAGMFLDMDSVLTEYPFVRNETVVEFRKWERSLAVYITDKSVQSHVVDERLSVRDLVKQVVESLGFREPGRFGFILLPQEEELFGISVAGQLASPPLSMTGRAQSNDSLNLRQAAARNSQTFSEGGLLTRKPSKSKYTRPVSSLFAAAGEGVTKQKDIGQDRRSGRTMSISMQQIPASAAASKENLSTLSEKPNVSGVRGFAGIGQVDLTKIIQTKDRSEWLKSDMTLRSQSVDEDDVVLLVRQEKILSFYDRLNEDPASICRVLCDAAESVLLSMKVLEREIDDIVSGKPQSKKEEPSAKSDMSITPAPESKFGDKSNNNWNRPVDSPIKMEGWLSKRGRMFDHWKRKYYRLRNRNMWYYKIQLDRKPVGHFSIIGAEVTQKANVKKHEFVFSVKVGKVERLFYVATETEMQDWIRILQIEASATNPV